MSADTVTLLHAVPRAKLESVLREGLRASSVFDTLDLAMRRGVVYCWLRQEDDKTHGRDPGYACVQVTVEVSRSRVAEMDFSSIAMMCRQGSGGKPQNAEVAALLVRVYELTSVPLSDYRPGMFWTPEVLVKGDIPAASITSMAKEDRQKEAEPANACDAIQRA